ncbi:hypothetical protein BCR44DRAFT_1436718 [Catenaria anguillulae PL171]|uniref:Uncharacterized protein n=1 Tax=Catenaria anguillulae PL171 TaxID=765915 RepID=A0A1Y2HHU1_9FUNG|nr:hypothetical protein BCR44DRAFT_1436709 [Catenaria anguillulae PL171]ORZ34170.1 hypothetical protein BCR44DRAFT_1436718 [Catenaria anguillulae PL171]
MPVARYAKSICDRAGRREENYLAAIVGGLVRLAQGKSVSLGGLVSPDKQASRASSPQGGLADAAAGRVLEAREDKEVLMSMKELEGLVESRCVQGIEEEETHSLFAGLKNLEELSTASGSPKTTSKAKGKAKASGKMITVKEDLSVPVKEQEEEGPLGVTKSLDVSSGIRAGQAVEGENDPVAVVEGEAGHEVGSNKNVESEQTVEHKILEGVQLASTSSEH